MPTSDSSAAVREHPDSQTPSSAEKPEEEPTKVTSRISLWRGSWQALSHARLPDWLQDNDFLLRGHRPPLFSFRACFRSIFRLHTETWNIWTHLIGCLFFLILGIAYMFSPNLNYVASLQDKMVLGVFFLGAALCMCFSWLFHTFYCHSQQVALILSRLDYCGIAILTMGSFIPWLYYTFYCSPQPRIIYLVAICILGATTIIITQWERFSRPEYRIFRVAVFLGLGLCGVIPTLHITILEGFLKASTYGQTEWLIVMALLYILGAAFYTARIPERFFPGWCDIWFHSHQIFHVLVILGALVHLYSIWRLQVLRASRGGCESDFFT
ncbi:adiponectin receptor protein 2-like isoform X1 [Rhinatrema bivittatum]|uniref:adiponectin receptor protein 2-like isoform X1 n=1 Tax=Rhinatrema bivittatum TaxID=194408 RepID=UPI00112C1C21|nr:adiponectin receptor protein 2-like isoform X1 [Rhinatrema bivittatum]XP_029466538.1 adiponectin receptor protein 2-like isoform X1 [Rhinatrema bivittatum]